MNILPRTDSDFTKKDYWDSFFVKRGNEAFEWYGEYRELRGIFEKYIKISDSILVIGCGNSNLSVDLYDAGYKSMMNIDISNVAIKQMQRKCKKRNGLVFKQMDVQKMEFEDGSFNVALDKGTLDALLPKDTVESKETVLNMFKDVSRVLKVGGRYIIVSLLQKHVLSYLLEQLPAMGFLVRICQCHDSDQLEHRMPVFVLVCTKLKVMPNFKPVLEVVVSGETVERVASAEAMVSRIGMSQQAAALCAGLASHSIADIATAEGEVSIDLMEPHSDMPRYTVVVVDAKCAKPPQNMTYAAFIVPQGREREWLFGTKEGRKTIVASSGMDRLAFILLHRGCQYTDQQAVQDEVGNAVRAMAPARIIKQKQKIPFLSVGPDLGNRREVYKGKSEMSGEYVIEDAEGDNSVIYRRLIFFSNQSLVQSEARLLPVSEGFPLMVDLDYLACQHHVYMLLGVYLAQKIIGKYDLKILIIGLGGGGLAMFTRRLFPQAFITVVDIDPEVKNIAVNYFGLEESDKMKIVIADGIDYIQKSMKSGDIFDAVLFDINSNEFVPGLSCPPKIFLENETLENTSKIISKKGIFILNFVCRLDSLREVTRDKHKRLFNDIKVISVKDEVNEIMFCWKDATRISVEDTVKSFNAALRKNSQRSSENEIDLDDLLVKKLS
ncbi:eEF1A lysine and N-terminal methyltransferase homolog [Nilaparvata lugens]|uniref:eEF1A lysine and N-terminal methyltransferase homolog n=1 Tax=Nilaparvata lugens TaxID=108931 RepID=UPI00193D2DD7|nr:eEF1A lysine and N-terminal methyltransferase homolog [Nilaparvata lugens]